ncbi:UNVERIFIED_ORG: hypothetical protein QOE_2359 [Clostridioides difficile F501]
MRCTSHDGGRKQRPRHTKGTNPEARRSSPEKDYIEEKR